MFRQHGYTRGAEQILIAQRRHARQVGRSSATWWRRAVNAVYATIGYGYRPARVLWVLGALLALVAVSLEVPAAQATLRATNGNGAVTCPAIPEPLTDPVCSSLVIAMMRLTGLFTWAQPASQPASREIRPEVCTT